MHHPSQHPVRFISAGLILVLLLPAAQAAPLEQGTPAQQAQGKSAPIDQAGLSLPDSPVPQQTPQTDSQAGAQTGTQTSQQPVPEQPQNGTQKPVGTAAAPYEKTMGVAASRPAGAVIAPAKQRRVRTIWISIAAVAGTAIAVGTVVGLSKASSSRP